MRALLRLFGLFLVLGSLIGSECLAADAETAALEMVKKLRLGDNMRAIGLQAASRTQTYLIITKNVGPERARSIVTEELEKAAPKYQGQWDKNLASAYAPLFS